MSSLIERDLQSWFADAKKVVVAGIGNPIRRDDFVGLKIVQALQGKVRPQVCLLECETVPEGYLLDIEKFQPSHVLLIDTAVLRRNAGEASLVDAEAVAGFSAVSSHVLPLRVFCEYVKKSTGAKVGLLLVEPKDLGFGEEVSSEVAEAAEKLTQILLAILS
ncbi:MAG: hydrogenase maturation protease [Candidatus Bathyarchaeota archaeon]|nr:hydrogenase maturation protease [Candidatus Bathyarchaeota archaeon]